MLYFNIVHYDWQIYVKMTLSPVMVLELGCGANCSKHLASHFLSLTFYNKKKPKSSTKFKLQMFMVDVVESY